jgi:hypothetical protein
MNHEMVKALSDKELSQFIILAQQEKQSREEKYERDVIAEIMAKAATINKKITIHEKRGRRPNRLGATKAKKAQA